MLPRPQSYGRRDPGTLAAVRVSIADYEVAEPWARDGCYVCRPPARLGRPGPVLVSELDTDADGWPQLCDHLVRLAAANPAGLLEALEVGPDPETKRVFLVTEYAEPAAATDGSNPGWNLGTAMTAVAGVARCAHALHEAGLTHGSIHSGRILRAERATRLDLPRLDAPPGTITRTGPWAEMVAVSPELFAGETASRSSDVWALGATLHTLLSDRPLYTGIDRDEPVTAVQRIMFTRPDLDPALPGSAAEVIAACLAFDPAERPQTAAEVADRLSGAVDSSGSETAR